MHVLIVEDDKGLAAALERILQENGYEVDVVHEGNSGLTWAESTIYDVIILDVMLPFQDGFSIARELRRKGVPTPILLLTARDATVDKITGLDAGADDYMTKPFSPAELMAHLRALTRRQGEVVFERQKAGDLSLDLDSQELACDGKSIRLSAKEFALMRVLMTNEGQVLSKDVLLDRAWGADADVGDNNVEAYISFLRKKLTHIGSHTEIETVRGLGYRLVTS